MKKIFKSNKGFSLLELLIVITVSMILVGGAALGISLLHNANVNAAAARLHLIPPGAFLWQRDRMPGHLL